MQEKEYVELERRRALVTKEYPEFSYAEADFQNAGRHGLIVSEQTRRRARIYLTAVGEDRLWLEDGWREYMNAGVAWCETQETISDRFTEIRGVKDE